MICAYCGSIGYGRLISERSYWTIHLAPSQRYLGTCVVANKRQCSNLSELETEEWKEFTEIVREMENTLNNIFKPTLFNWSCFKNASFRDKNPHPQVHWHLIPRYDEMKVFEGIKFEDLDFGYIPQPISRKISEDVMENMWIKISEQLNNSKI
ncbi:MAG: HIT family protein [Methanobacterium sp. ERen5]|nr:MAG: HIT family protein [Methanobacterium sp. ERen5]